MIPISEIVYSMSGEGSSAGYPTVIVRVAGCNLVEDFDSPCKWCDTKYAWYKSQGKAMTLEQILEKVRQYHCNRVLLTGGEPLAIEGISSLIEALADSDEPDFIIEVETNGSISIIEVAEVWPYITFTVDIKTPSSGNDNRNCYENLARLDKGSQVKFVVKDREDFDFALGILTTYPTEAQILFSPVWGEMEAKELAGWIMKDYPKGRLSLQLHKLIGVQ